MSARGSKRNNRQRLLDKALLKDPGKVREAIAAGAEVNAEDGWSQTPLHWCNNPECIHLLIAAGADVNAQNHNRQTPLHISIEPESALALLQAGADSMIRDKLGMTPAEYHRSYDNHGVVEVIEQWRYAHRRVAALQASLDGAEQRQGPCL